MGANKDRLVQSGVIPANKADKLTPAEETVIEGLGETEMQHLEAIRDKVAKEHESNGGDVDALEPNFIV